MDKFDVDVITKLYDNIDNSLDEQNERLDNIENNFNNMYEQLIKMMLEFNKLKLDIKNKE
jgi:hypothetical protein